MNASRDCKFFSWTARPDADIAGSDRSVEASVVDGDAVRDRGITMAMAVI